MRLGTNGATNARRGNHFANIARIDRVTMAYLLSVGIVHINGGRQGLANGSVRRKEILALHGVVDAKIGCRLKRYGMEFAAYIETNMQENAMPVIFTTAGSGENMHIVARGV